MTSGTKMLFGDALLTAITGYAIVFLGILLLVGVVTITARLMTVRERKPSPAPSQPAAPRAPAPRKAPENRPAAPGTAGDIKLYGTDPKTAAMIMAIVADEMQTPINELRFKSIREVKENEV